MQKENETVNDGEILAWSVVVPNYNGQKVLGRCVDALLEAAAGAGAPGEIIIVDDASADASLSVLDHYAEMINIVPRKKNGGFSAACNTGFDAAAGDVVLLFNNDVALEPDIIAKALAHFKDTDLFAVSFYAFDENGTPRIGKVRPVFKKGFLKGNPVEAGPAAQSAGPTFFASGGGAAFRRDMLSELGGFDEKFNPFYWEDTDLSYRAWKRGWKIIYDPACRLLHPSHGVISSAYSRIFADTISRRNQLLFFWKNVDAAGMWAAHLAFLSLKLLTSLVTFKFGFIKSFGMAARLLGHVAAERRKNKSVRKKSDAEIIALFNDIE